MKETRTAIIATIITAIIICLCSNVLPAAAEINSMVFSKLAASEAVTIK